MSVVFDPTKQYGPDNFLGESLLPELRDLPILEEAPQVEGSDQDLAFHRSGMLRPVSGLWTPTEDKHILTLDDLIHLEDVEQHLTAHRKHHHHAASPHSASHLAERHRLQGVRAGVSYVHKQARENPNMPYTQGPERWSCVHAALKGHVFRNGDCSSTTTALLRYALRHSGGDKKKTHRDRPNHLAYHGGYTGTLRMHGWHLAVPTRRMDQVHYGSGTGVHVAPYVGGGLVLSHGSPGWHLLIVHYRFDYSHARRTL